MKRLVCALLCLGLMTPALCEAKPEQYKKGKPADQAVLTAPIQFIASSSAAADGDLREWEGVEEVSFSTLLAGEYEADWTGPKDLSASMKTLYSDKAFHMYVKVNDNAVVDKLKNWKSDKVEVWLQAVDKNGKAIGSLTGIQYDIGPLVTRNAMGVKILAGNKDISKIQASPFLNNDADGYDIEMSIDFSLLAKESPVGDGGLRYCVLVRDWDQDDPYEDEAAIGSCPINPAKPSSLKPNDMAFVRFDLDRVMWQSVMGADSLVGSQDGKWIMKKANVANTAEKETIGYLNNVLAVAGFALDETGKLSWASMALNGASTDPEVTFSDLDGDKLDEIILKRTESCAEDGVEARRVYVFDYSDAAGLRLAVNYLDSVKDTNTGKSFTNKSQMTKKGIVQTLGSGAPIQCTLDNSADMETMLEPGGEKKRTLTL